MVQMQELLKHFVKSVHNNSSRGFTLIELLITITIIAVLSAIGLVAYGAFLKTSRDSRRQSDLKLIQSALEDYHSDQLYYPPSITPGASLTFGSDKTYLNKIPVDPKSPPEYLYEGRSAGCTDTACTSYCLFANMENNPPVSDQNCSSFPSSDYNFGVTRP